jgi:hypothetical protein
MIEEEKKEQEELEVNLGENPEDKEIEVPENPIDKYISEAQEEEKVETKQQEEKPKAPPYSEDMPYSEKVRKRIAKEVAKRAEAEQKAVELEQRLSELEKKTYEVAGKSLSNQYQSVSAELKSAIEDGNTDKQVELYEKMADLRGQMQKTSEYAESQPKKEDKKEANTPPLARDWVKMNAKWFNKPGFRKETAMAYGIDAELTEEGWDVNDPEYYEEMDRRLKASGLKHFTKSDENTSNDDQNVVQKTNRVQSPVAGVSRKKTSNSNRVKLTADDLATAKNFGIDINDEAALKRFAKEVKNFSTNT